ncbi:MAG: NFACT RNA binding domain-containing protein [Gemmatimonadaceae bacterium]
MDSLTLHYVARELDAAWRGRKVTVFHIDRRRRTITLGVAPAAVVCIDLGAPAPTLYRDAGDDVDAGLLAGWVIAEVSAPEDERRLVVRLDRPGKFRGSVARAGSLEVSFVPSARGARLADARGPALATLGPPLPAVAPPRPLLSGDDFASTADEPARIRHGRWMSPWLERWLLHEPEHAAERYALVAALPAPQPSRCGELLLPFPACARAESVASLVPDRATEIAAPSAGAKRGTRALARMRRELARADDAGRLREIADTLMSLGDVAAPKRVTLGGGDVADVAADPGESAVQVAERLYRDVRSMERARERLPSRIAALEAKGEDEAREAGEAATAGRPARRRTAAVPSKPYRSYLSSGGLVIWVGRGAASNEALTFRESSPDDVWLHARDSAGAHVVLRWQKDESPPARDLEEAAMLAAWHSRSRGSTVVPVDWTRRKHVRKPRGAAPGLVLVDRAETVFVRPSAEAERRLRSDR